MNPMQSPNTGPGRGLCNTSDTMKIKSSDITYHGRNVSGLSVFTCYSRGLGRYATDSRGQQARRDALAYFTEQAKRA